MEPNTAKTTSYLDLLRHFRKADRPPQTCTEPLAPFDPRPQPLKPCVHLRRQPAHKQHNQHKQHKQNKQNLASGHDHIQSLHQQSVYSKPEWQQQDVLKQWARTRKDRQLQLTYNKFLAQITHILSAVTRTVPPVLSSRLTYLQYLAALKELLLIKETYQPSQHDSVGQLWGELATHGSSVAVFITFVTSMLNLTRSQDENSNNLCHLAKKYSDLRFTRMQMQGKVRSPQDEQQYLFTPNISHMSRTVAGSRSKSKDKSARRQTHKSYRRLDQRSLQAHPQYPQYAQKSPPQPMDDFVGNRRSELLFKLAKQNTYQKRRDKKSSEVQYQKSIKELTFHPIIHQLSHGKQRQGRKKVQGEQDSIDRMVRGRVERQVRRIIQEKGLPYNERMFQKMKKERYQALQRQKNHHNITTQYSLPQPLQFQLPTRPHPSTQGTTPTQHQPTKKQPIVLSIQIHQGHCENLIIEDLSNYKEAASKFIQDFKLKPETYDKLLEGVESALKFQLTPIDEVTCESQYESAD